jgi:hypothetical protein
MSDSNSLTSQNNTFRIQIMNNVLTPSRLRHDVTAVTGMNAGTALQMTRESKHVATYLKHKVVCRKLI